MKKLQAFGIKMWKSVLLIELFLTIILISFSSAVSYDLNMSIECNDSANQDVSNDYKLIVMNSETANETINFTLEYYITQNNVYVSGFPKETSNDLKRQRTITRSWTPKNSGIFVICSRIISSTITDENSANNLACKEVFVIGSPESENNNENTSNSSSQETAEQPQQQTIVQNTSAIANNSAKETEKENVLNQENVVKTANKTTAKTASKEESKEQAEENLQQDSAETSLLTGNAITVYESKNEFMKRNALHLFLLLIIMLLIYRIVKNK